MVDEKPAASVGMKTAETMNPGPFNIGPQPGDEDDGLDNAGAQALVQRARASYQIALFQHAIVAITDRAGRIRYANDRFCEISQYSRKELVGQTHRIVNSGKHPPEFWRDLWQRLSARKSWQGEICNRAKDGSLYWVDTTIVPIMDDDGQVSEYLAIRTVSTGRKQLEARLRRAAYTDPLTGLPNRAALLERLATREPGAATRFAVLFIDLDRFKLVNDSLGHGAGDDVLRQVARRVKGALQDLSGRSTTLDGFATRLGGDEFVVYLDGVTATAQVAALANRLLSTLAEPFEVDGVQVSLSASIGLVIREHCEDNAEAVLRDADTAMYEAKRRGRNQHATFTPALHEQAVLALGLHHDMRMGLERGEFHVEYQPIVDLLSTEVRSVEALARWRHPTRGSVTPLVFIPLAEENGLINDIGRHVLRTACRQMAEWQTTWSARAPEQISVNLSRAQLLNGALVSEVHAALRDAGLAPRHLQLELTESLAMVDPTALKTLQALRSMGVGLSLDDFGVGYSSLSCLQELPITSVKIDRSLVPRLGDDRVRRSLVKATLLICEALELDVVVEGVEDQQQADLLRSLGCKTAQGFLFGRPAAADALAARWHSPQGTPAARE